MSDPDTLSLFARRGRAAQAAADTAIRRVGTNADAVWWRATMAILVEWAQSPGQEFTTDDLEQEMVRRRIAPPHEPRALGALMVAAARQGLVIGTTTYRSSTSVRCHGRPKRVWRTRR